MSEKEITLDSYIIDLENVLMKRPPPQSSFYLAPEPYVADFGDEGLLKILQDDKLHWA